MSIILRLQNLPWSANSLDIRRYFQGLSIPEGGVHIVGGEKGDAFIAFTTDEDARQAMERDGGKVKEIKIKLMLSSRVEMQKVIDQARSQCAPTHNNNVPAPAAKPKENEKSRTPERSKKSSPDRKRDKERDRSPRDRDRDKNSNRKSSSSSTSRKDRSRSRSPSRRNRDRDSDRRSKRSDDRRRSDDVSKSRDESSKHDNNIDNRSSQQMMPSGNNESASFGLPPQNIMRNSGGDVGFGPMFNQSKPQQPNIEPWVDKIPIWEDPRNVMMGGGVNKAEGFRPGLQQEFMNRDPFGRGSDGMNPVNSLSQLDEKNERSRSTLPPAFETGGGPRSMYNDSGLGFAKQGDDSLTKSFRSYDSDQRIQSQMRPGFEDSSNPTRGFGFCVEVRGLPVSVSYKDIRDIFRGIFITNDGLKLINDENGQRSGTAFIRLTNQRDVNEALKRNRQFVGDTYIDVFRCADSVFEQAVDSYLPPVMKKSVSVQPRPEDLVVHLRGLPYSCKEDEIISFFDGLRILDIYIEQDFNGRSAGNAYVEFGTSVDYHAAMAMHRRTIGHRYIEVVVANKEMMMSSRNQKSGQDSQSSERQQLSKDQLPQQEARPFCVALQGLPFHITDRDIADFFSDVGVPLAMHIMLNPDRLPTGEAFVEYANLPQFEMALNKSGKFIGPNMIKVLSIPYDEMMEVLGNPVGKTEPLLTRPGLSDARGKGPHDDQDILSRAVIGRPRPMMRDMDESNSSRLGLGDTGRAFGGPMRGDAIPNRGFNSEQQQDMPVRGGGFSDVLGFRGLQDSMAANRNFSNDSRNFGSRPFMDASDRSRGFSGDSGAMKQRGFMGDDRSPRVGGRHNEQDGFDDLGRNRRLQDDVGGKRLTDSPDPRMRGPADRPDMKSMGRHGLDQNQDGRTMRGGPDRRGMGLPPGALNPNPNAGPGLPEGFNKPGCVVGAGNVPYRATIEEILGLFKDYKLKKENVLRRFDYLGRITGDARIAFPTPEDAKKAIAELNGTSLSGRTISLFVA